MCRSRAIWKSSQPWFDAAGQAALQADSLPSAVPSLGANEHDRNRRRKRAARRKAFQLRDIPSGYYWIMIYTQATADTPAAFQRGSRSEAIFRNQANHAARRPDGENRSFVRAAYARCLKGNRTAVLKFEMADGNPAAGKNVVISYIVDHYGLTPVFSGQSARIGRSYVERYERRQARRIQRPATVFGARWARIRWAGSASSPVVNRPRTSTSAVRRRPATWPRRGTAQRGRRQNHQAQRLARQARGARFWATWCGPCQPALEKLDTVAAEKADAWKDRVVSCRSASTTNPRKRRSI